MFSSKKNHEWISERLSLLKHKVPERELMMVMEAVREPLVLLDSELRVELANQSFFEAFRVAPHGERGQKIFDMVDGQWDNARLRELLEGILLGQIQTESFELERLCPTGERRSLLVSAYRLNRGGKRSTRVLLTFRELSEGHKAGEAADEAEGRLSEAEERVAELEAALEKEGLECQRAAKEAQELRDDILRAEERVVRLERANSELEGKVAELQAFRQKAGKASKGLKEAEDKISTLEGDNEKLRKSLEGLKKSEEGFRKEAGNLKKAEERIAELKAANQELKKDVDSLREAEEAGLKMLDKLKEAEGRIAELEEALERETADKCKAQEALAGLEEAHGRLQAEVAESKKAERQHHEAQRELARKLDELASADTLTNVYNRGYFVEKLEEAFQGALRSGLDLSLMILDLDDFKTVNETHGYQAGDAYLQALADLVARSVRPTDVVARYGGDNLALVLPLTPSEGARVVAKRIQMAVTTLEFHHEEDVISCTASMGVASCCPRSMESADDFLKAAERALYTARRAGRNKVAVWPDEEVLSPPE